MNENGYQPQFSNDLGYNDARNVVSERKRQWDGLIIPQLEMKKPNQYKNHSDMIYTYDLQCMKAPYPVSLNTVVTPKLYGGAGYGYGGGKFDGLDPGVIYWKPLIVTVPTRRIPMVTLEIADAVHAMSSDNLVLCLPGTTFYPVTEYSDNGYWHATGLFCNNVLFGDYNVNLKYNAFVRFPSPTIPPGSIINTCILKLTSYSNASVETCNVNIYFNDTDAAIAPTNETEANDLILTSPINSIVPPWQNGIKYNLPELKTILQSIIDRPGYVIGNALQIVILNNGSSAGAMRYAWAKFDGNPVPPPELYVEWS